MSNIRELMYGPEYYGTSWTLLGLAFLLGAFCLVYIIIRATRKKKVKTLQSLSPKPVKKIPIDTLKIKYTNLLSQAVADFNAHRIKASEAHQRISLLARLFFCEARSFKADVMTLQDLKKSRYKALAAMIDEYYPNEFDTLEHDSVQAAAEKARKLIEEAR